MNLNYASCIEDDKDKLHVFNKNGLYLATRKIRKNNPKAEQIKENNEVRMQWNHEVDRALLYVRIVILFIDMNHEKIFLSPLDSDVTS